MGSVVSFVQGSVVTGTTQASVAVSGVESGDVIVLVESTNHSPDGFATSFSGLGATWTLQSSSQATSFGTRFWIGTGASSSSGTVTGSGGGNVSTNGRSVGAYVLRGVTTTGVSSASATASGSSTPTAISADEGDVVIGAGYSATALEAINATTPSTAWVYQDAVNLSGGTRFSRSAHRVAGSTANHTITAYRFAGPSTASTIRLRTSGAESLPRVVDRVFVNDYNTSSSSARTIDFGETIQSGDVVALIVFGDLRALPTFTVSGLGATWTSRLRSTDGGNTAVPSSEVFTGTATSDGTISVTPSATFRAAYYALLIRGASESVVAASTSGTSSTSLSGPSQSAQAGNVIASVVAVSGSSSGGHGYAAVTPSLSTWGRDRVSATAYGVTDAAFRIAHESIATTHQVTSSGDSRDLRVVQVVVGSAASTGIDATLNATAPAPVVSLAATVEQPATTATLNATAPLPVVSLSATVATGSPVDVTLNAVAPLPVVSLAATVEAPAGDVTATLNATAPAPVVSLGAVVNGGDLSDHVVFKAAARIGYLTIPTAQPPPAGIDPVPVARYSHVAPAPTEANPIIREGHDYDWVNPVEVGTVHVFVGGVDVTYLWGAPVQMVEWSSTSPLGDAVASFEIPSMQAWEKPGEGLYPDAPVQVVLVHTDDTRTNLWHGYLSADAATSGQRKRHGFSAEGLLWQAGHALHEPPHYMPPTDIGVMVPRILNAVPNKRWSDIPEVTTGLYTQNRGSGNQYADQITTEILARDGWTVDQQQWTLQEIAPGEIRMVLKPPMDDYDCTITYGIRNYDVQLSREQASRFDVIKAKGVTNAGGQWRGTRFPGLVLATPPPYPNNDASSMHVGDTDADTDSGTGISDFQRRLVELGYSLRVDGVYNSSDADVVRRLQSRMGLLVDGVVGPQTWSGIFNRGPSDIDLTQWREPIAALPWTQKYLRDPNGVILGTNPEHDDSRVVHEVEIDAGTNITWTQFQPIAEKILAVESEPALTGTITLTADPHEMWRGEIKVGTRIRVLGFQGEDVIVRVGAVDARIDQERGLVMTLTVDERARDAMSIDQILSRERARLSDPARKPGNPARDSRITRDRYVQWDIDSPCGFFPRTAVFGGLWVAPNPIPFSEVGRFVKFVCSSTVPFALMLFGLPVKPSQVNAIVGNPLATTDPYRPHTEALSRLGWIEAWGEQGQRMGYWPGDEGSGYAFTGKTELIGSVDYVSGYGVWAWPLIYSATTGFVGGGSGDWISRFYPATDT